MSELKYEAPNQVKIYQCKKKQKSPTYFFFSEKYQRQILAFTIKSKREWL
jgi:hypothetical protein